MPKPGRRDGMEYTVHRKSLGEFEADIVGSTLYGKDTEKGKLAIIFRKNGEIDNDLNSIDDVKLLGQMARREWRRKDFESELEYLVASTTGGLKPLQDMAYRLSTYETDIMIHSGVAGWRATPLRLYLLAVIDDTGPFDVWIEVTPRGAGWGKVKGIHGWRKTPRGGKR